MTELIGVSVFFRTNDAVGPAVMCQAALFAAASSSESGVERRLSMHEKTDSHLDGGAGLDTSPANPEGPASSDLWRRWIADRGSKVIVGLTLFLVAYVAWQFFGWGGPGRRQAIGDIAFWPVNLAASMLAFRVAWTRTFRTRVRRAWLLIGLGLVAYLLGDVLQLVYELVLNEKPYPTFADAAYLAFYPLLLAGILQFPHDRLHGFALVRICLDAAAATVAGAAIVWYVTLASATAGSSRLQLAVSIAYPCGDLLLILALTALAVRSRRILGSWSLGLIKGSVILYIAADIIYGRMTIEGTYSGGSWVDVGWMFAIALMAASANEQYRVAMRGMSPAEARSTEGGFVFLPYVATAVTLVLMAFSVRSEGALETGILVLLAADLAIVLARLHWTTLDSRRNNRQAEQARSEFFATISHELRTPLTAIRGFCELLAEADDRSDEERDMIRIIQRNAIREERLVTDLLLLSSSDLTHNLHIAAVDLVSLANDAISSSTPNATQANIAVEWHRPDEEIIVQVDPIRMGQVLDNLLTNAIKFSGEGSIVLVTVDANPDTASVRVQDSGPGIPEDEQSHIFDRLYRGQQARDNAIPGAGLGLAIARGIVEAFDGSIYLEPHEGRGALFRIDLPTMVVNMGTRSANAAGHSPRVDEHRRHQLHH